MTTSSSTTTSVPPKPEATSLAGEDALRSPKGAKEMLPYSRELVACEGSFMGGISEAAVSLAASLPWASSHSRAAPPDGSAGDDVGCALGNVGGGVAERSSMRSTLAPSEGPVLVGG